jgi:hypothetical protein
MEFKEELLGRICRLYGITNLKREISYLENQNANEETAYENLIYFALIFLKGNAFSLSVLPTII